MNHRNKLRASSTKSATNCLRQQTVSLGPRIQWDSRDNVFYPKKGSLHRRQHGLLQHRAGEQMELSILQSRLQ